MQRILVLGLVILLSQFAFYMSAYTFLRTHLSIWHFMLLVLPILLFSSWGPLWSLRFATEQRWPLLPVQLSVFGAAVLASLVGIMALQRQVPRWSGWIGLALVIVGVVISAL